MIRKLQPSDRTEYLNMAEAFYASGAAEHAVDKSHFAAAFDELMRSDVYAECYVIEHDAAVAGYALLAKTFSQEAGGLTVWLDELFIKPAYRGMGFGGVFLDYLGEAYPNARRVRLEVCDIGGRAAELYRRHGFEELPYRQMVREP